MHNHIQKVPRSIISHDLTIWSYRTTNPSKFRPQVGSINHNLELHLPYFPPSYRVFSMTRFVLVVSIPTSLISGNTLLSILMSMNSLIYLILLALIDISILITLFSPCSVESRDCTVEGIPWHSGNRSENRRRAKEGRREKEQCHPLSSILFLFLF